MHETSLVIVGLYVSGNVMDSYPNSRAVSFAGVRGAEGGSFGDVLVNGLRNDVHGVKCIYTPLDDVLKGR